VDRHPARLRRVASDVAKAARRPGQIDSAETIVNRVEMALRYLPPERIALNPDCGLASGCAAKVSPDDVYTKLKNEVAAAMMLRDKYA
jgi:5-methyltetrahydropteroyltriglutamate--homocysteine methyltransferase